MIFQQIKNLDIEKIGDLNEGIQAGISEESLPFVFEMMSNSLYSNPIGSIVREITSNCFDSHIEAKVNDPVIVSLDYDKEEGHSISFKDVGVGLSPERIEKIYMNYFTSTKRNTNDQIGSWGLGSKSPLAYASMFYITTIFDGLEYEYIFHKGENKPTLESLLGYEEILEDKIVVLKDEWGEVTDETEIIQVSKRIPIGTPTEEHNGTTIRIVIEDNSKTKAFNELSDMDKFKKEIKFQLAYFDSVYFKNLGISNDYDIYEGDYFKFRSDMDQHNTSIHLVIGKVRYPIDLSKVNVAKQHQNIPVAIKFEIGELKVTPSREALRYNTKGIELIEERIRLAAKEIIELFEAQNPGIEDLKEYVSTMNDVPKINFNAEKEHVLYLWSHSGISKNFKFKPLAGLSIKKTPDRLFFMWEKIGYINRDGKRVMYEEYNRQSIDNEFILQGKYIIANKEDRFSSYTDIYISKEYISYSNSTLYIIKRKEIEYNSVAKLLGIKESATVGKAKTIMDYMKVMNKMVTSKGYKYSDLRPTDEWIANYKKSIIESTAAYQRRKNKRVFVRDMSMFSNNGIELSVAELESRTGILVYGFKEDAQTLNNIWTTVMTNKSSVKNLKSKHTKRGYISQKERRNKAFMVIQVAKSSEKDIIGAEKTIYWTDFLKTKFFRKILTSREIYYRMLSPELSNMSLREMYLIDFKEDRELARNSIKDFSVNGSFNIRDSKIENIPFIESMFTEVDRYVSKHGNTKVPLIGSLNSNLGDSAKKEVADYLKYKGIKLRKELYLKSKEQLLEEARDRDFKIKIDIILAMLQTPELFPQNKLLTFTLNQTENDNEESRNTEESSSSSTEESSYNETSSEESNIGKEGNNFYEF